jgi:hypothetical protein
VLADVLELELHSDIQVAHTGIAVQLGEVLDKLLAVVVGYSGTGQVAELTCTKAAGKSQKEEFDCR